MKLYVASDIREFKNIINEIKNRAQEVWEDNYKTLKANKKTTSFCPTQQEVWFRGVSNASFELIPSLLRKQYKNKQFLNDRIVINEFKRYYRKIIDKKTEELADFECLYLLQHYGVPTKLLDFTSNEDIALYFATCDAFFNNDDIDSEQVIKEFLEGDMLGNKSGISQNGSAVYCIDPVRYYLEREYSYVKSNVILEADKVNIDEYINEDIVFINPQITDNRIKAQSGKFVYFSKQLDSLDGRHYYKGMKDRYDYLIKIFIPENSRFYIKKELKEIYNLTHSKLFPDMEGIAKEMNDYYIQNYHFDKKVMKE